MSEFMCSELSRRTTEAAGFNNHVTERFVMPFKRRLRISPSAKYTYLRIHMFPELPCRIHRDTKPARPIHKTILSVRVTGSYEWFFRPRRRSPTGAQLRVHEAGFLIAPLVLDRYRRNHDLSRARSDRGDGRQFFTMK